MLPDPMHPAIVHLPIALCLLLPLLSGVGALVIWRGLLPTRAWGGIVLLSLVLVLSTWAALETGEDEEDRVEEIVAHEHIEAHEEAAEQFMWIAALLLLVSGAGMLESKLGNATRLASVVLALVLLAAGLQVGRLGGALVYEHGAAAAYGSSASEDE